MAAGDMAREEAATQLLAEKNQADTHQSVWRGNLYPDLHWSECCLLRPDGCRGHRGCSVSEGCVAGYSAPREVAVRVGCGSAVKLSKKGPPILFFEQTLNKQHPSFCHPFPRQSEMKVPVSEYTTQVFFCFDNNDSKSNYKVLQIFKQIK